MKIKFAVIALMAVSALLSTVDSVRANKQAEVDYVVRMEARAGLINRLTNGLHSMAANDRPYDVFIFGVSTARNETKAILAEKKVPASLKSVHNSLRYYASAIDATLDSLKKARESKNKKDKQENMDAAVIYTQQADVGLRDWARRTGHLSR